MLTRATQTCQYWPSAGQSVRPAAEANTLASALLIRGKAFQVMAISALGSPRSGFPSGHGPDIAAVSVGVASSWVSVLQSSPDHGPGRRSQ